MVRKPSLDENTELTLPLLSESEEKVAVQSCTTYNNTLISSSSSSSGVRDHEMAAVMGFFSEHLHRRSQLEDDADVYEVPQGR